MDPPEFRKIGDIIPEFWRIQLRTTMGKLVFNIFPGQLKK
jgi:hypothetical protein